MKDLYMKNFNGDKIFSLEYDKETLKDMVLDKQEEIERLNNIIKEAREYVQTMYTYGIKNNSLQRNELLEILDKENNDDSNI